MYPLDLVVTFAIFKPVYILQRTTGLFFVTRSFLATIYKGVLFFQKAKMGNFLFLEICNEFLYAKQLDGKSLTNDVA